MVFEIINELWSFPVVEYILPFFCLSVLMIVLLRMFSNTFYGCDYTVSDSDYEEESEPIMKSDETDGATGFWICPYCDCLNSITLLECPHCGAPRKDNLYG